MAVTAYLRQSTAVTVPIGPFVDNTDGDTEKTALSIASTDVLLSKNGGTLIAKTHAGDATHQTKGMYGCPLNTADVDTLGVMSLVVHVAGALFVRHDYMVMPPAVWDAFFGSGLLPIDASAFLDEPNAIDGETTRRALAIIAAICAGLLSGARSGTEVFLGLDGVTPRAVINANAQGNRTNATYP